MVVDIQSQVLIRRRAVSDLAVNSITSITYSSQRRLITYSNTNYLFRMASFSKSYSKVFDQMGTQG